MKNILSTRYLQIILSFFMLFIFLILYYPTEYKKSSKTLSVSNENDNSKIYLDINGDGKKDSSYVKDSKLYIEINKEIICLSDYASCKNLKVSNSWPAKIFFKKISRKPSYEIILLSNTSSENLNRNNITIFTYQDGGIKEVFSKDNNIFGVLNLDTARTPECFCQNSYESIKSSTAFMCVPDKAKIIQSPKENIPAIDCIQKFIDIIEADYEVTEVGNIFTSDIPSEELALIWNLDKEYNKYSFQNGYFENIDQKNDSINWFLSFEKYPTDKNDSEKQEIIIKVSTKKQNNIYKISSIEKSFNDSYINLLIN